MWRSISCATPLWLLLVCHAAMAAPPTTPGSGDLPAPREVLTAEPDTAIDLETALQWTLTRNPELVAVRQNRPVSQAAWDVARQFPMSINPTVSVDVRPWTFDGLTNESLDAVFSIAWMQPIQLGHPNEHRSNIGRANFRRATWQIVQAELLALVQTYRLHQTALYRHEKLNVARQLADYNRRLAETTQRQLQAALVSPADAILAEVASQAMTQQLQTAEQAYVDALTALRRQLGIPGLAASLTTDGQLRLPEGPQSTDVDDLVQIALEVHPDINALRAQVASSAAAVRLARTNRIPIPSVGPLYESDESGTTFYGIGVSTPVFVLNAGQPLLFQRAAEYRRDVVRLNQTRRRITADVQAALAKWNRTKSLVEEVLSSTSAIQGQNERMDRLFAAGQTNLITLLQARRPLIQAENARLDMIWQAIQAYADVLQATGGAPLFGALRP